MGTLNQTPLYREATRASQIIIGENSRLAADEERCYTRLRFSYLLQHFAAYYPISKITDI